MVLESNVLADVMTTSCAHEFAAGQIMTTSVVTIEASDTFWNAWLLLGRTGLRHLIVMEQGRCVGVLHERFVLQECCELHILPQHRQISDVLNGELHAVLPEASVSEVARMMLHNRLDAVLVVSLQGSVLGIITSGDLIAVLAVAGAMQPELPDQVPVRT